MKHGPIDPDSDRRSSCACERASCADQMMRALVADELEAIREMLEEVGMHLCIDPVMIEKYSVVLQGIDELAQRNENLARVLRAPAMEPALDTISLESLRNRLLQGLAGRSAIAPAG